MPGLRDPSTVIQIEIAEIGKRQARSNPGPQEEESQGIEVREKTCDIEISLMFGNFRESKSLVDAAGTRQTDELLLSTRGDSRPATRNKAIALEKTPPRPPAAVSDSDASRPSNRLSGGLGGLSNIKRRAGEIGTIEAQIDAEGGTEPGRPAGQLPIGSAASKVAHLSDSGERLCGADQHRRRESLSLGDRVQKEVHTVGEVNIGEAGRPVHDLGARGESAMSVAGRIVFSDVSLDLHDAAGQDVVIEVAH